MAEESIPGNGHRIDTAVDKSFNQWLGKIVLPAAVGAAMLFAGIVGGQVLATQKETASILATMQIDVAVMKTDIGYLKEKARQ